MRLVFGIYQDNNNEDSLGFFDPPRYMPDRSFHLRIGDRAMIRQTIVIVCLAVTVHIFWFSCGARCYAFFWGFWAMIWLPVLLGYIASFIEWKINGIKVSTLQRCAALILAVIIDIIFSHIFDSSDSAGYVLLFYIFLFLPLELVLVVSIDSIIFLTRFLLRKYAR